MKKEEFVKIGTVVNCVGLKGELKVMNYAQDPERFEMIDTAYIEEEPYSVRSVRYHKNMVILGLEGIDDRDSAEKMRRKDICMSADDLEETEEGEHYIRDLLGMDVILEDESRLGELFDIRTDTSQPLYCIRRDDGSTVYLPGVREFILMIDEQKSRITVRLPDGLLEL